jgi:hypothetical protein
MYSSTTTSTPTITSTIFIGPTTTTSTLVVTATPTVAPPPVDFVACQFWDISGAAYQFDIYNIEGDWLTDGGKRLEKEEKGCGALTYWKWVAGTADNDPYVHFYLPLFLKAGCVERAIHSAGGPTIKCARQSEKRDIRPMEAVPLIPTEEELETLRAVYANVTGTDGLAYPYIPMQWSEVSNSSIIAATSLSTRWSG